jgi:DNA end-binding protein Ku
MGYAGSMRSMWKGAISFGLVMIPVKLYAATEQKDIAFRQVHRTDGGRIRFRRVCSVDGEEVPYEDVAKGYELPTGEMVVLTDEDMADLPLPTTRSIEVVHFMPAEQLDPILLNRSYFVEPESAGARAYVLLRDSLDRSGKVALTMVALRQRESLATLRTRNGVLVLETLLWPDEIRVPDFPFLSDDIEVRSQELKMAASLIDSMTEDFDPDAYHDNYREALQEVVDAKVEGREVVQPEGVSVATEPTSLADALKASLAAARRGPARAGEIRGEAGASAAAGETRAAGASATAGEIKTAKAPRRAIADGAKTRSTPAGRTRASDGKDGAGAAAARSRRSKTGDETEDAASSAAPAKTAPGPAAKQPAKEAETPSTSTQPRGRRRAS